MKDPAEIKITWNAYNLTTNIGAGIQISLWGYRETKTRPEFEYITALEVCTRQSQTVVDGITIN